MKPPFCLLLILILPLKLCAETEGTTEKSHFRLFAAEVNIGVLGGNVNQHRLFRIDMRTGRTWWLSSVTDTNGLRDQWVEVRESTAQNRISDSEWASVITFLGWLKSHPDGGELAGQTVKKADVTRLLAETTAKLQSMLNAVQTSEPSHKP